MFFPQQITARRKAQISSAQAELFDLIIIGGGIHGASLCRQAARAGLRTLLFDAQDFASGISSKSSKLLHGGLRYLEQLDFALVREALTERCYQRAQAPHLTRPLPFLFPIMKDSTRPAWQVGIGLTIYDGLAQLFQADGVAEYAREFKRHTRVSGNEPVHKELKALGLSYSALFRYFDGQMDDTRIAIENIVDALLAEAIALNYCSVTDVVFRDGVEPRWEVNFLDHYNTTVGQATAKFLVNLAGPWVPTVHQLVGPWQKDWPVPVFSRGTHLFFDVPVCSEGLILPTNEAGRIYFVLPYYTPSGMASFVGPTSVTVAENVDQPQASAEEISELLGYLQRDFPAAGFAEDRLTHTISGMRILAGSSGSTGTGSNGSAVGVSRSDYFVTLPRYRALLGGKYTTAFRTAANILNEAVVELGGALELVEQTVVELATAPLPGGVGWNADARSQIAHGVLHSICSEFKLHPDFASDRKDGLVGEVHALVDRFGSRATAIAGAYSIDGSPLLPSDATPDSALDALLLRQAAYAVRVEGATSVGDVLSRLGLDDFPADAERASRLLAPYFAIGRMHS